MHGCLDSSSGDWDSNAQSNEKRMCAFNCICHNPFL